MTRLILILIALALCLLAGQGQSTELDVSANVVGVIRSDATLLVPNRYAATGQIVLPQGDGYRVVLAPVERPAWSFSVMSSGSKGRATFEGREWDFDSARTIRAEAGNGRLTVVAHP